MLQFWAIRNLETTEGMRGFSNITCIDGSLSVPVLVLGLFPQ